MSQKQTVAKTNSEEKGIMSPTRRNRKPEYEIVKNYKTKKTERQSKYEEVSDN